jgi:hypothetical protein
MQQSIHNSVVTNCKVSIILISDSNPVYSHYHTIDIIHKLGKNSMMKHKGVYFLNNEQNPPRRVLGLRMEERHPAKEGSCEYIE